MGNVVDIKKSINIPDGIRLIADGIEDGEYGDVDGCTIIIGTNVFHLGPFGDERDAANAIYDMSIGIAKLTNAGLEI